MYIGFYPRPENDGFAVPESVNFGHKLMFKTEIHSRRLMVHQSDRYLASTVPPDLPETGDVDHKQSSTE
jgi:hypothetical protein